MIRLIYFLIKPVNDGKKEKKNHKGQKLFSQTPSALQFQ